MSKTNLSYFTVSDPDLIECSLKEIEEICDVSTQKHKSAVVFSIEDTLKIIELFKRNQSLQTICILLDNCSDVSQFSLSHLQDLQNIFGENTTFSVDVTGVKGQENRIEIAKLFYPKLHEELANLGLQELMLEHKTPQLLFQIYDTGEGYLVGLQLNVKDFSSREFRVFAHQASFKGDFAYRSVRELDVNPKDTVLCLFAKDGAIAIEAALFQNNLNVRKIEKNDYINNIPLFNEVLSNPSTIDSTEKIMVTAVDTSIGTTRAMRNNSKIAGVLEYIKILKCSLDDLDTKFEKETFSKVIIHMTRKDENDLNDVYYQLKYVLKSKAKALFINRTGFEIVVPDTFTEVFRKTAMRGGSTYSFVCVEKK